jgi:hypothetical protein
MSFPYITDLLNAASGTRWDIAIPTFGVIVAAAIHPDEKKQIARK